VLASVGAGLRAVGVLLVVLELLLVVVVALAAVTALLWIDCIQSPLEMSGWAVLKRAVRCGAPGDEKARK